MNGGTQERNPTTVSTPSDTETRIERIFDAPRELVWEAYTDPEMVAEWLGPDSDSKPEVSADFRPGGTYRWDFGTYVFFGEYHEIDAPERLVCSFDWEGSGREASVDDARFEQLADGRTRIVILTKFASKEDRDNIIEHGMEKGVREGYAKLDVLLDRLRADRG